MFQDYEQFLRGLPPEKFFVSTRPLKSDDVSLRHSQGFKMNDYCACGSLGHLKTIGSENLIYSATLMALKPHSASQSPQSTQFSFIS